ncbi:hypothetical protein ACLIYP_22180 [Streptomyces nanhaiensis]|uniref:hypothetical protein n=1 Tax=Streptomyces nanhaiensis TaxID=679319 RepID=UPI00399C4F42
MATSYSLRDCRSRMDRRLIQTAVLGSPESDEPVVCPEDAEELDRFRREHANDTWWCGINLPGGCGRQLMTKRYTDKVCHFAHYRDGGDEHQCSRQARGRDSANHLFVKADFAAWLRAQGVSAEFEYPEPLGSAVLVRLEDGRVLLVHLDKDRPVMWDDGTVWEIVLGPGVRISPDALAHRGHVHRIRFDNEPGGRRSVKAGIEMPGVGSRWFDLHELVLTADGLTAADQPTAGQFAASAPAPATTAASTPVQRTIVSVAPPAVRKVPASRQPDPVRRAVLRLDGALHDNQPRRVLEAMQAVQNLLEEDAGQDALEDLSAALARGERWREQRARRRKTVVSRLKEEFEAGRPIDTLLKQATDLVSDRDTPDHERAVVDDVRARARHMEEERRKAREREEAERREAEKREQAQRRAAARQVIKEREDRVARQARVEQLQPIAATVRGALKKAAREGRTTTWSDLQSRTGQRRLGRLSHQDKVEVLVLVERDTKAEDPLWSVLLATGGDVAALQLHRDVAHRLGRPLPADDADLINQLAAERAELHRQYP